MTYSSALCQKSNTQLQQNFQGLQHQLVYEQFGNLNNSNGLQQRHNLKRGLSGQIGFAANPGDGPGVAAQEIHLQDQHPSEPNKKWELCSPLLIGLLRSNPPNERDLFPQPPSLLKKTDFNVEVNTNNHSSEERHCTRQQVRSSSATVNGGQARHFIPLNNNNGGHTHSDRGLSFCTNDSIFQSDCIMSKLSVSHLLAASAFHKEDMESCALVGRCTAALGQALEEDNLKGSKASVELTPKYKETGNGVKWTTGNRATEYQQIQMKVAASHTKNCALPGRTMDKVTEKHASSAFNCSASQEPHRSMGLNIHHSLDGIDQARGVSLTPKHKTKKKKANAGNGLDNMRANVTGLSAHVQTRPTSSSVVSENRTFELPPLAEHSKLHASVDQILIHNVVSLHPANSQSQWLCSYTSGVGAGQHVGLSTQLAEDKAKEHTALAESKVKDIPHVKCSLYEDISDDDEDLGFVAHFKNPQYEDISEDENPQIKNMAEERPSLLQVPQPYNKQSLFKNEGYPHVQGQTPIKTGIIHNEERQVEPKTKTTDVAQRCFCPRVVETSDAFAGPLCPICAGERPLGWQTNHSAPTIPSSGLDDEGEADDETDDDWVVFPISMSDLKFEADGEEDQDLPGEAMLADKEKQSDTNQAHSDTRLHFPAHKPEAVSASPQLEIFDTLESFRQAKTAEFKNKRVASGQRTPEHEMDSVGEPQVNRTRRKSYSEAEDSCETEDSCDYSSGSEHNYLTVSTQLLKKRSAPLLSKTDDSKSEKEGQHEDMTLQKSQTSRFHKLGYAEKLRQLIEAKASSEAVKQKSSQQDHIIILDSDSEDESDQNCKANSKRNGLIHSDSVDSRDDPYSRRSPETVASQSGRFQEKLTITKPSPSHSPAPQRQCKDVVPDDYSKVPSDIIILDSDMEDDYDQKAERNFFWCLADSDVDAPHVPRRRLSAETVENERGTSEEKLSSAGPSALRNDMMQDEPSDVLHSTQNTKALIEAAGGSKNVQQQVNEQRVSNKVAKKDRLRERRPHTRGLLSSTSADGGGDFITTNGQSTETEDSHCGIAKPKKPRVSPEDAPQKRPQSVDKETASSLGRDTRNSCLGLREPSPANHKLKLTKESRLHVQAEVEPCASATPPSTKEKANSWEKTAQHLYRRKEGKCMSITKSANDATENKVEINMGKARLALPPSQRGSSASTIKSSSTCGRLPESRQSPSSSRRLSQSGETSVASRLRTSKHNASVPRLHSYCSPSTLDLPHAALKGPSSAASNVKLSAIKQVTEDWQKSFSPTLRDRKYNLRMERDFHAMNSDSPRDTRPQPSRGDKSATPLMKKSKCDAMELTKAIRRDAPRQRGYPVGRGYKWSEKPAATKPMKGFRRKEK